MNLNFDADEDTSLIIDKLINKFLQTHFMHDKSELDTLVNHYYETLAPRLMASNNQHEVFDLLFHHDHPYFVAARIHFLNDEHLQEKYDAYYDWLRAEKGGFSVPYLAGIDYTVWWNQLLQG